MKFITWDTGIIAVFVVLLAYSLLIRKHKSLATLVSIYIAYIMASAWGGQIASFFAGNSLLLNRVWIRASLSPVLVESAFMLLIAFLLSTFIKLGGRRSKYTSIEVIAYATSTMALAVMFIVSFMTPEIRDHTCSISKIVPFVYHWRQWILVVPVFLMIFFGIYANEDH